MLQNAVVGFDRQRLNSALAFRGDYGIFTLMDWYAPNSRENRIRVGSESTFSRMMLLTVIMVASAGFLGASQPNLTGTWQHVGPQGQTTLRVDDTDTAIHVVVEGHNFLTFDEFRFVPDGTDHESGRRLVQCQRTGDSLVTAFRRMGTAETADGAIEVVRSSKKIVWALTDESTLKLSVSGSRGQARMLARDFVFERKDPNNNLGYNTLEEEEEQ